MMYFKSVLYSINENKMRNLKFSNPDNLDNEQNQVEWNFVILLLQCTITRSVKGILSFFIVNFTYYILYHSDEKDYNLF